MTIGCAIWIAVGLFLLGLCIDNGLTNIARSWEQQVSLGRDIRNDRKRHMV